MGQHAHRALLLVLENIQASGEAAAEHEELPGSELLHLNLLPALLVIFQHLPVLDFLQDWFLQSTASPSDEHEDARLCSLQRPMQGARSLP